MIVTGPPAATPVTTPVALTVASAGSLVSQVITRPVSTTPFASLVVAVKATVWPAVTLAADGATVTEATGGSVTVIAAVPDWPSLVAVMVTGPPAATPVTIPVVLTVASAASLVDQTTARSVRPSPLASLGVAVRATV